jgi:hypothetical protein
MAVNSRDSGRPTFALEFSPHSRAAGVHECAVEAETDISMQVLEKGSMNIRGRNIDFPVIERSERSGIRLE